MGSLRLAAVRFSALPIVVSVFGDQPQAGAVLSVLSGQATLLRSHTQCKALYQARCRLQDTNLLEALIYERSEIR